ncbi:MAG: hypothetical protein ACXABY_21130 [Candidatus Thorarchaeota archaeon]|jgi:hypothetical protein
MGIVTIAEVLERVDEFERKLSESYSNMSQTSSREGVRLLTDYMGRHRRRTLEALAILPPKRRQHICRITLRYDPQGGDESHRLEGVDLPTDATAADVLDAAIEFDERLIRLYKQVVQQAVDLDVKDLFEGLIRFELKNLIELKKTKALDYF